MKVSTKTRYALRLMFQLALEYGKGPLMLGEIARREKLSVKYLSLIVISLRAAGLIDSVRGAKGGYFLMRAPSRITVKDIFLATDGQISVVDCSSKDNCKRTIGCVTREVWSRLNKAIEKTLDDIILEDLVQKYRKQMSGQIVYEI